MQERFSFLAAICALGFGATAYAADNGVIEQGKKVAIQYTLKVDGKVVEDSSHGKRIEFVYGSGEVLAGL